MSRKSSLLISLRSDVTMIARQIIPTDYDCILTLYSTECKYWQPGDVRLSRLNGERREILQGPSDF